MSQLLRVDQINVERWGRATGFSQPLPDDHFVVLFGSNESGKTSLATAMAWLLAGPGSGSLLQRFGGGGDVVAATLRGRLGSDPVQIAVRAQVPKTGTKRVMGEGFEASVGGAPLNRDELSARLGVGDFDSHQRFYWVEALEVADGGGLQESVSVLAMFGGVDPFGEAEALWEASRELVGSLRGKAATDSARDLHRHLLLLETQLRAAEGGKDEWARLEAELAATRDRREHLEQEARSRKARLESARLAEHAFQTGLVTARNSKYTELESLTEPAPAQRDLHRRTSDVQACIGELRAAHGQRQSAQLKFVEAHDAVHGEWRSLVELPDLGTAGLKAVAGAEGELTQAKEKLDASERATQCESAKYLWLRDNAEELTREWQQKYPHGRNPAQVARIGDARWDRSAHPGVRVGTTDGSRLGRLMGLGSSLVGLGCVIALTVLMAVAGEWWPTAIAATGATALGLALGAAIRSASAPDPAMLRLAQRCVEAEQQRDEAQQAHLTANSESAGLRSAVKQRQRDYRDCLTALGVPLALAAKFETADAVAHLRSVTEAQAARRQQLRASDDERVALEEVQSALGTDEGHRSVEVSIADAREAEAHLTTVRDLVDSYDVADSEAQEAADALRRAVNFDEEALQYIDDGDVSAARTAAASIATECETIDTDLQESTEAVAGLLAEQKGLKSPSDTAADLTLRRSALEMRIEDRVVGGLARHLAATLLEEVAEQHRKTRQPSLLERTRQMTQSVADWTNVTVNPHTSGRATAGNHADNLLVDGPRGEHPAHQLSFGAQSLLYLALRFATVESQAETRGVRLPLILDDVLVGLDDDRARSCMNLLAEVSERHQMILLTCHEGTAELAEGAGARVLTMPPRQTSAGI